MKPNYRAFLMKEFNERIKRNAKYSLRSFARDLSLAPSRISEILNSKQGLSLSAAKKLSEKLRLSELDGEIFCNLVIMEHGRSLRARRDAEQKVKVLLKDSKMSRRLLHIDQLVCVSEKTFERWERSIRSGTENFIREADKKGDHDLKQYQIMISIAEIKE